MKKSNFWYGLVSSTMGAGLIVLGFFWNTPVSSLMCGCGGALLGPGLVQLWKDPAGECGYLPGAARTGADRPAG